jgi:hypothetical protein
MPVTGHPRQATMVAPTNQILVGASGETIDNHDQFGRSSLSRLPQIDSQQ